MEKVLFDTDIGNDIDDALALAYLLKQPKCDLAGITTVTTAPELRAKMCSAICRNAGRPEVPIHVGCSHSLLIDVPQKYPFQAAGLKGWDCAEFSPENTAIEFMYQTIKANPDEINLLAVGPMTNVAVLFATHPDVPKMLKSLVLMCGRFGYGGAREWNAINDPHATAIVYGNSFHARPAVHYSCGTDVTEKCRLSREIGREKFKKFDVLAPVRDFADIWFERAPHVTFHDPLAAVCLFEPDMCTWHDVYVDVSTTAPAAGYTVPRYEHEVKPHKIGMGVDSERFFNHYFEILGR